MQVLLNVLRFQANCPITWASRGTEKHLADLGDLSKFVSLHVLKNHWTIWYLKNSANYSEEQTFFLSWKQFLSSCSHSFLFPFLNNVKNCQCTVLTTKRSHTNRFLNQNRNFFLNVYHIPGGVLDVSESIMNTGETELPGLPPG